MDGLEKASKLTRSQNTCQPDPRQPSDATQRPDAGQKKRENGGDSDEYGSAGGMRRDGVEGDGYS
jgi:hypothetical protein